MLNLTTDYRGKVEYSSEDIIRFTEALYGFEGKTKYLLIANSEKELPFHWLQSIEDESLAFVVTDPFLFVENYDFELDDTIVDNLNIESIEDVGVYTTVIIPNDLADVTINLKSPIIINMRTREAKQVVLEGDFPFKHNIFNKERN
jgi:flagellar assembly factor FliW